MTPLTPLGKKPPGCEALPRYTIASTSVGVRENAKLPLPDGIRFSACCADHMPNSSVILQDGDVSVSMLWCRHAAVSNIALNARLHAS